jgi:hypothetical protein
MEMTDMKKAQEEFCKCCFSINLTHFVEPSRMKWEEELRERPDYYLWVDETKYAVEISTIPDVLQALDSGKFSLASFIAAIQKLIQDIEVHSLREGILAGKYHVMSWGPFSNFRQTRRRIQEGILDYIHHTQAVSKAPLEMIIDKGIERCAIEKVSAGEKRIVTSFGGPNLVAWETEAQSEACELLESVITKKASLLQDITLPKILVLEDAYPFLECTQVSANCIQGIAEAETFETIFIVETYDRGQVVHGKALADYAGSSYD